MGYWFGFKGDPSYGLFIILTIIRTSSSENFTFRLDANGVTNSLASSYERNHIIDFRETLEICNSTVGEECLLNNGARNPCVFDKKKFICQCKKNLREVKGQYPADGNISYCILVRDVINVGEPCILTDVCDQYSECDRLENVCKCKKGYEPFPVKNNVSSCIYQIRKQKANKNQEIYKAAMVALACFILAVLGVFLLYVWNRSIQSRRLSEGAGMDNRSRDDIFSICDGLAIERLKDKPPTYEDVARSDQQVLGMPPPVYSTNEGESPSTAANQTRPFPSSSSAPYATGHHNQAFISDA